MCSRVKDLRYPVFYNDLHKDRKQNVTFDITGGLNDIVFWEEIPGPKYKEYLDSTAIEFAGGSRIEEPNTLVDVILKKDYVFSVQNEMKDGNIVNQHWVRTKRLNCYDKEEVKSCMIEFKEDMQIQTCLVN